MDERMDGWKDGWGDFYLPARSSSSKLLEKKSFPLSKRRHKISIVFKREFKLYFWSLLTERYAVPDGFLFWYLNEYTFRMPGQICVESCVLNAQANGIFACKRTVRWEQWTNLPSGDFFPSILQPALFSDTKLLNVNEWECALVWSPPFLISSSTSDACKEYLLAKH